MSLESKVKSTLCIKSMFNHNSFIFLSKFLLQTPLKVVKLNNSSSLVCVLEPNPAIVSCEHGFSCLSCSQERDVCDHLKYLHYLKENAHEAPDDVLDLVLTAAAVT